MTDVLLIGPFPEDPSVIKGGVQASVYGLARALLKRDDIGRVKVLSVAIKADKRAIHSRIVEGIEVTYLNAPYKFLISGIVHVPLLMRCIRQLSQPVVHLHGTGLFQAALIAVLRRKRVPFVWTLLGIMEKEAQQVLSEQRSIGNLGRYLLYTPLERLSLRLAPLIIVATHYVREAVHAPREKLHVIPLGIFTEEFAGMEKSPRDEPLILCLGVLDPRKGHTFTLDAFARVREKLPGARLVIAGAAPIPEYLQLMHDRVAALDIADSVEIRVNRPRQEILDLLSRARVFALHSQEESQGIALCEAMAAGVPIVATHIGGIPYVVTDRRDGFLVEYGDVEGFADAILRLLTDEKLYAEMATQAQQSAQRFDWDSIAERVTELYHRASASSPATRRPVPTS